MRFANVGAAALLSFFLAVPAVADPLVVPPVVKGAAKVRVETVLVHGAALEGNLEGNAVDRPVIVYLPPSYAKEPNRRYPVVYALHGYSIDNQKWTTEIKTPQTVEGAFATGTAEMIVVLPHSQTLHNGSMYSDSQTTGDFEDYVAHDVVAYIDAHYRTIPARDSRGLVGHSMGGYGATRIGMRHPDVFAGLYIMSPCCLSAREAPPPEASRKLEALVRTITKPEEAAKLDDFMLRATLAVCSSWSPNPKAPPLYVDLPTKDGVVQQEVLAKWAANAPLAMIDQYIGNLRRYRAIAMDVGNHDGLVADTRKLHGVLESYGIANALEVYEGDHVSAVADRFQNHVLPFFAKTLAFEQP